MRKHIDKSMKPQMGEADGTIIAEECVEEEIVDEGEEYEYYDEEAADGSKSKTSSRKSPARRGLTGSGTTPPP
jgi:hypothetical protein